MAGRGSGVCEVQHAAGSVGAMVARPHRCVADLALPEEAVQYSQRQRRAAPPQPRERCTQSMHARDGVGEESAWRAADRPVVHSTAAVVLVVSTGRANMRTGSRPR